MTGGATWRGQAGESGQEAGLYGGNLKEEPVCKYSLTWTSLTGDGKLLDHWGRCVAIEICLMYPPVGSLSKEDPVKMEA